MFASLRLTEIRSAQILKVSDVLTSYVTHDNVLHIKKKNFLTVPKWWFYGIAVKSSFLRAIKIAEFTFRQSS